MPDSHRKSREPSQYDTTEGANQRSPRYGETRQAIADIVKSLPKGTHITAPEVFERAKQLGLDISLSTVYRTLHKLKIHGDVTTVSGDRGLRYEMAEEGEDHDHLICLGCGLTIEFVDELIHGFGRTVAQRKGFEHLSSRFDILGYCSACASQDQVRRIEQCADVLTSAAETAEDAIGFIRQSIDYQHSRKFNRSAASVQSALERLKQVTADLQSALNSMPNEA